jgi:2,4-dienoyl-CoA reductase (NADPH2)
VTLFERASELGGQFNLAKKIPGKQEFAESVAYYAERLRRAKVKVVLQKAPTVEELRGYGEIVIATGVHPRTPDIPGIDHPKVAGYADVLAGRIEAGREVAILGMGGIGFDVALYLLEGDSRSALDRAQFGAHWGITADRNAAGGLDPAAPASKKPRRRITMMKRSTTPFGHSLGRTTGWVHRAELARNGVRMLKGVQYRAIDDTGVHISSEGKDLVIPADTVIVCAGQEPRRDITGHHLIGGAKEAGELDAKRAMLEGAQLGAKL